MTDYKLLKIPDNVVISELRKENKLLKIEVGKLKSYIDELEDVKSKFNEDIRIEVRKSEIDRLKVNGDWQRMLNLLKKLKDENRRLITRLSNINANMEYDKQI